MREPVDGASSVHCRLSAALSADREASDSVAAPSVVAQAATRRVKGKKISLRWFTAGLPINVPITLKHAGFRLRQF